MRVGVTGGTGFIGQYLIRDYEKEYDFVVPVRNWNHTLEQSHNTVYVKSDFSAQNLADIFKGCDAVIHLAAKVMPKKKIALRMEEYMQNVVCAANVFEACKETGIKNIICTSTRSIFGDRKKSQSLTIAEDDQPSPMDEYAVSKLCVETLADFYHRTYGMNITTYRISEVCGMDLTRGMLNPFWSVVLNAVGEKKAVPLYGTGSGGRDLIYVKDVTRALIMGLKKKKNGVFHIGSGHITTNKEIAEAFCEVFDNKAGIEFYPEKPEWGINQCLNVEKARRELGYETIYDILKIVRDIQKESVYASFSKG